MLVWTGAWCCLMLAVETLSIPPIYSERRRLPANHHQSDWPPPYFHVRCEEHRLQSLWAKCCFCCVVLCGVSGAFSISPRSQPESEEAACCTPSKVSQSSAAHITDATRLCKDWVKSQFIRNGTIPQDGGGSLRRDESFQAREHATMAGRGSEDTRWPRAGWRCAATRSVAALTPLAERSGTQRNAASVLTVHVRLCSALAGAELPVCTRVKGHRLVPV